LEHLHIVMVEEQQRSGVVDCSQTDVKELLNRPTSWMHVVA
jgi:hypothetical protein